MTDIETPMIEEDLHDLEQRRETLRESLLDTRPENLAEIMESYQPAEIAEAVEDLPLERQIRILRNVPEEDGIEIFDDLETVTQAAILAEFREWRAARYLEEMAPDERADLFGELPGQLATKFLSLLPAEERADVKLLLTHEGTTAGGLMTSDFAHVSPDMTIGEVLEALREQFHDLEMIYYVYVLDEEKHLVGLLTLRYILLTPPDARVGDVMHTNVVRLREDIDQEIVAQELALYDFIAMPIVNQNDQMVGIVTFDDVVDVMDEEAAEDQELFGGMSPSEDDYMDQSVIQGVKQRLPWLAMFLVLSSGSTFALEYFQLKINEAEGLNVAKFFIGVIVLFPMIMAMAGNAATQTATLIIRSLHIRDIKGRDIGRVLGHELLLGLLMGLVLGILAFGRAWLAAEISPVVLGTAVAMSIVAVIGISTVVGASLPLILHGLGLDPAVMSSPLIATLIDIVSVIVYFQISFLLCWAFVLT